MTIAELFNASDFMTPDDNVIVWASVEDKENDTDNWYKCEASRIWNSEQTVAKFGFTYGLGNIYIALAE